MGIGSYLQRSLTLGNGGNVRVSLRIADPKLARSGRPTGARIRGLVGIDFWQAGRVCAVLGFSPPLSVRLGKEVGVKVNAARASRQARGRGRDTCEVGRRVSQETSVA